MVADKLGENRLRECETTQFYSQLFMTVSIERIEVKRLVEAFGLLQAGGIGF